MLRYFFCDHKNIKTTPEMKRSRSVDSSRYQTFCVTRSEQKVINKIYPVPQNQGKLWNLGHEDTDSSDR